MAEYQKLGEHRQTFLPASMSDDTVVRALGLIAGGLAIVAGICVTAAWWVGAITFALLALAQVLAAGLRSRFAGLHRGARLDLFDYGLTVYRSGQEIVAFRWDTVEVRQEVVRFQTSTPSAAGYSFSLTGPGGVHGAFDEHQFAEAHEWGPAIQSAVTAMQLSRVVAAIDAEEAVRFGDIVVDLLEIGYDGMRYPWERVQIIDARGGLIKIKFAGRWISMVPVESIPNFYIFNEVAERLRIAAAEELAERIAQQAVPGEDEQKTAADVEQADTEVAAADQALEPESAVLGTAEPAEPDVELEPAAPNGSDLDAAEPREPDAARDAELPASGPPDELTVDVESAFVTGQSDAAEPDQMRQLSTSSADQRNA
jgi:hypothetical protein